MHTRRIARKARLGVPFGILNQLATLTALYGDTDKGDHGYLPFYERHLGPLRLHRNTVYEIGVGGFTSTAASGSLAIWRDYFPRSLIIGLDINNKNIHFGPRVRFEQVDQNNPVQLEAVVAKHGAPSIVIDDGSHIGEHQLTSFRTLFPTVRRGGFYVIEDLSTSFYADYGGSHPAPAVSGVGLLSTLVSDVQAADPMFGLRPDLGAAPSPEYDQIGPIHIYPGIAFVEKV